MESGGALQRIDGREVRLAFETPMPRGFESREQALAAAREHRRTQFARIGVDPTTVEVDLIDDAEAIEDDESVGSDPAVTAPPG